LAVHRGIIGSCFELFGLLRPGKIRKLRDSFGGFAAINMRIFPECQLHRRVPHQFLAGLGIDSGMDQERRTGVPQRMEVDPPFCFYLQKMTRFSSFWWLFGQPLHSGLGNISSELCYSPKTGPGYKVEVVV